MRNLLQIRALAKNMIGGRKIIGAKACGDVALIAAIEGTALDSLCRLACPLHHHDVKRSFNLR
jgi:hypothetical protein